MSRPDKDGRSGYVALLAVTFAFGLATLGAALAVSARSYIESAALRERAILDRISLESAASQALADIAASGARPLGPVQLDAVRINSRSLETEVSIPEAKVDLGMDDETRIREVVSQFAAGPSIDQTGTHQGLAAWARDAGLSTAAEDCLRRRATFGRAPEPFSKALGSGADQESRLGVGDQVDLRVQLEIDGMSRVLWVRARYVGGETEWRIHDYRRLGGRMAEDCVAPPPAR